MDVVYILLILLLFALTWGFIWLCEKLEGANR